MSSLFSSWLGKWPIKTYNEFFITLVYFVQGSTAITSVGLTLLLGTTLGLDYYQIGLMSATTALPWSLKPIFGLLTDFVAIGQYRRKPYLHIGPLLALSGFLLMANYGNSFVSILCFLLIANTGLSLTDVATDGFVVEESNDENAARIQGLTQSAIRIASFLGLLFAGALVQYKVVSPHGMYFIAAIFPCITFCSSFFIEEANQKYIPSLQEVPPEGLDLSKSYSFFKEHNTSQEKPILHWVFITSLIGIIGLLVGHVILTAQHGDAMNIWLKELHPWIDSGVISTILWAMFGVWIYLYFKRLIRLGLSTHTLFIAIIFLILWRINPGVGVSLFYYLKDVQNLDIAQIGYIDAVAQLGAFIGAIAAVFISKILPLRWTLSLTVLLSGVFGLSAFGITQVEYAEWIGDFPIVHSITNIMIYPAKSIDSFVQFLTSFVETINNTSTSSAGILLTPYTRFLYLRQFLGEFIFMLAFVPLLQLAVIICPPQAEATNFAVITTIMNMCLSLSTWIEGSLYNHFMASYYPELNPATPVPEIMEMLFWVSIITTLMALVVIPFLPEHKAGYSGEK